MYYVASLLAPISLVLVPTLYPQTQSAAEGQKTCAVWGQVAGDANSIRDGLDVELVRGHTARERVHVSSAGNFEFEPVPPGDYQFRVLDRSGAVVLEQSEALGGKGDFVLLLIRDPKIQTFATNTVSFARLRHKTPSRAWDAFRAAQKAANAGDIRKSVQLLSDSLTIDPDFAEAHSDLAARFAKMGRMDEALQHAQTAFGLNSELPEAGCNLALLLVTQRKYDEAELVARRLLNGHYYLPELHGVLAISLIGQQRNMAEALNHLEQAAGDIPFIRLLAARALAEFGQPALALSQVKSYLQSSAHDCERQELEAWATSVESQQKSQR